MDKADRAECLGFRALAGLQGGATPKSILDPEMNATWDKVAPANIATAPYRAVGKVRVLRGTQEVTSGTCWLASNNVAVTAAHVVVEQWVQPEARVEVIFPGLDQRITAIDCSLPPNYGQSTTSYDPWDIAFLRLEQGTRQPLGWPGSSGTTVQVLGFPFAGQNTMVESRGPALDPDSIVLLHRADTVPGHSGGPVLRVAGSSQGVVAVHISGFEGNPYKVEHGIQNVALALRPELAALISEHVVDWR